MNWPHFNEVALQTYLQGLFLFVYYDTTLKPRYMHVCVCVSRRCHGFCTQGGNPKQDPCHWKDGSGFLSSSVR